jgi:hypothetical protein
MSFLLKCPLRRVFFYLIAKIFSKYKCKIKENLPYNIEIIKNILNNIQIGIDNYLNFVIIYLGT